MRDLILGWITRWLRVVAYVWHAPDGIEWRLVVDRRGCGVYWLERLEGVVWHRLAPVVDIAGPSWMENETNGEDVPLYCHGVTLTLGPNDHLPAEVDFIIASPVRAVALRRYPRT